MSNKVLKNILDFYLPIIKYSLFWQAYFQTLRLLFFVYHSDKIFPIQPLQLFKTFWYGIHVDLTLTSYIMILPVLVFYVQLFFRKVFYRKILQVYTAVIIIVTALISLIDLELYSSWGFKINKEFLFYLQFPEEALASVTLSYSIVLLSILYAFLITVIIVALNRKVIKKLALPIAFKSTKTLKINLFIVLFFSAIVAVGIRGGTNLAPFNPSYVYFSNRPILNHTALNATWNLMYSSLQQETELLYDYMTQVEENERIHQLYPTSSCDTTLAVLNSTHPNVVLVILEGWTSDIVEHLGGVEGVSPNFDTLINEGLLFTNFYASGDRTYKGVPAILSGFPSLPIGSIIKYTSKMEKLSSISEELNAKDYYTSFLYGGELSFANIRAYIQHCGFDKVIDKFHFSPSEYRGYKWGIHDHLLFERAIAELNSEKQPFFTTLLTQSSHEPYTVPMETKFPGTDRNELFKNSVSYTDKSLGEFIAQAKTKAWYDNTLFVFLADHGKNLPLDRQQWSPEMFKIPLLFYGNVLKSEFKGQHIEKYGSQTDLAKTLLSQINAPSQRFSWSQNLLSCSQNFAFYNYNGGFGWVTPEVELAYDLKSNRLFYDNHKKEQGNSNNEIINAKAYMQKLGKSFNEM